VKTPREDETIFLLEGTGTLRPDKAKVTRIVRTIEALPDPEYPDNAEPVLVTESVKFLLSRLLEIEDHKIPDDHEQVEALTGASMKSLALTLT